LRVVVCPYPFWAKSFMALFITAVLVAALISSFCLVDLATTHSLIERLLNNNRRFIPCQ